MKNLFFNANPLYEEIKRKLFIQCNAFAIASTIPIVLLGLTYDFNLNLLFLNLGVISFLGFNILITRLGNFEFALMFSATAAYTLLSMTPLYLGNAHGNYISIMAVFTFITYASSKNYQFILNNVMAIIAFLVYRYLITIHQENIVENIWLYDSMIGVCILGAAIALKFYYQKEIGKIQQEQEKTLNYFHQIAELNPNLIYTKDTNRAYTYVNESFANTIALDREQCIGKRAEELNQNNSDVSPIVDSDNAILREGKSMFNVKLNVVNQVGEEIVLDMTKTPITNGKGQIIGLLGVASNITEATNQQKELADFASLLETTLESTTDGIIATDKNKDVLLASQRFLEIWDLDDAVDLSCDISPVLEKLEDPDEFLRRVDEIYSQPAIESFDQIKFKDGRIIERYSTPRRTGEELNGRVWSYRDVTHRVKTEFALKESEKRYRTLFEKAPVGILILDIDKEKKALAVNEKWPQMLKTTRQKILDGNMISHSPEVQPDGTPTPQKLREALALYRSNRKTHAFEWQFKRPDGSLLWGEVILTPVEWQGAQETMMMVRDIDAQKKQEQIIQKNVDELNQKNLELEKYIGSNMQLENFAYLASHDLKTPIRTLVGFSQLLQRSAKDRLKNNELDYLRFIDSASKNMQDLIEDLLSYSRVNTKKQEHEEIDLSYLLNTIIEEIKPAINEKKAIIQRENLPEKIYGDKTQMRQLFQNLVINAIKFSKPETPPEVILSATEQQQSWKFSIKDNGIGIKPEYHEKIFLLFKRLHNSSEYEGTGIGLALCKKIVEKHLGKIWVESNENQGTTFHFTLHNPN